MNTRPVLLAAIMTLSMTFMACAKTHNSGGSDSDSGFGSSSKSSERSEQSYHFIYNGCDTGQHDFSSPSAAETQQKLCLALQNDELNHFCAEQTRYEYFNEVCSGYTWKGY